MASLHPIYEALSEHLGEMATTPAGEGTLVGLVDRNEELGLLVDLGERLPGGIPVVMAFRVVRSESSRSGLAVTSMARAAEVARRDGAMESSAGWDGAMESTQWAR